LRAFDDLIGAYPPGVQTLALQARTLLFELLPGAEESVDSSGPYVSYGYGPGYKGVVCYMTISRTGVKLGIAGGAALDDPHGLLEGSGKVHRHVALRAPADLRRRGLKPLVRAGLSAWRKASAEPRRPAKK
jgi:hypothetical protein